MNKIDWFKSKTEKEWESYFMSRMPFSEEDKIDLEDYVIWKAVNNIKYRPSENQAQK